MKELQGCGDFSFRTTGQDGYHDCWTRDLNSTLKLFRESYLYRVHKGEQGSCDLDEVIRAGTGFNGVQKNYCQSGSS